jgi:probable HAF family extracellular repeat protein
VRLYLMCLLAGTLVACSNDELNPVDARPVAMPVAIPVANSLSDGTTIQIGAPAFLGGGPGHEGSQALVINQQGRVLGQLTQHCCSFTWQAGVFSATSHLTFHGLNDQDQIVGIGLNGHAVLNHYPDLAVQDLGTVTPYPYSEAWSINHSGAVVGWSGTLTVRRAFLWTPSQGMQDLGTLAGLNAVAMDINDAGQVVGYASDVDDQNARAFLWTQAGGLQDLGLPPNATAARLLAINNSGVAVGSATMPNFQEHAMVWSATTGWIDLQVASGLAQAHSVANDINNQGLIVGASSDGPAGPCPSPGRMCAAVWHSDFSMSLLPVPPGANPQTESAAHGVNDLGQVVGWAGYANGGVPFEATLWLVGTGSGVPTASTTGPYAISEGEAVVLDASTSIDPEGDPLTYVWTFGDGSPAVQGAQASHVYQDYGSPYTVLLTARDPSGLSNTVSTTVTVENRPPAVVITPVDSVVAGTTASWVAEMSDPGIDDGTYLITYDWGDGTPPDTFSLSDEGMLSRNHAYGTVGSYALVVSARDRDLAVGADTFNVLVVPVNRPPIAVPGGPYSADEGSPVAFDGSRSHDFDGDALSYAWDFGDGSTGTGASPTHSFASFGTYSVSLRVTDAFGLSATVMTQAVIGNLAPSVAAGPDFSIPVGAVAGPSFSFSDPGTGDGPWIVDTDWGNGAHSSGPYPQGVVGQGTIYQTTGTYRVVFRATDRGGATAVDTVIITVTGNGPPIAAISGPVTGKEGSSIVFGNASTDPNGDPLTYRWTFGDGTTSTARSPSHVYTDNGVYNVTLTAKDPKGLSSTASATTTISNVAPTATFARPSSINEGKGFTLSLTGTTDPSTKDRNAGFQYAFDCGTGLGAFGAVASIACPVQPDNRSVAVAAQVRDKDGGVRQYTGSISVKNVVPNVIVSAGGATTIQSGATFTLSGSFTDPGLLDAPWNYSITWGDGTSTTGGTGVPGTPVVATHRFTKRGTWTIRMTVTDRNGGKGTSNALAVTVQ